MQVPFSKDVYKRQILISPNQKASNCTVDRSIKDSDHYPIWCYIGKQ